MPLITPKNYYFPYLKNTFKFIDFRTFYSDLTRHLFSHRTNQTKDGALVIALQLPVHASGFLSNLELSLFRGGGRLCGRTMAGDIAQKDENRDGDPWRLDLVPEHSRLGPWDPFDGHGKAAQVRIPTDRKPDPDVAHCLWRRGSCKNN